MFIVLATVPLQKRVRASGNQVNNTGLNSVRESETKNLTGKTTHPDITGNR